MKITPGRGTGTLHLRQSSSNILDILGPPAKRRESGKLREHWAYPDRGIEVVVSRRTRHLLSIFIDRKSGLIDRELQDFTAQQVRDAFGAPASTGGGVTLGNGTYFGVWFSYDSGIGFHFDRAGKLETVAIFAPRRKFKAQVDASHRASHSDQVAAMRQ